MNYPVENHARGAADSSKVTHERQLLQSGNTHGRTDRTLEHSLNEIYLFDTQTLRFEYVNPVAQRNLGYHMAALRLMTLLDLEPAYNETSFRGMLKPLLCGEKDVVIFEASLTRANGTRYPVEFHLQLFTQQGGHPAFLAIGRDITTRQHAEIALREREEWFRTMVNTIPQLAWIANPDGSRTWYNQRWYDYSGATQEEMEGWGWQKLHDPVLLPQVMKSWNTAIAAEQVFDMEFPLRGADGQFRIFLTRAEPLRNSEGHIVKWLGTNTDVHDQRLAEQARRETENQLQVVMENMTEGLVVSDFSRKLLHWNRAALKMHDVTSADEALLDLDSFASKYELSTLDGAVLPAKLWPLIRVLQGEQLQDLELRLRRVNRDWVRVLSYSGAISHYGDGKGLAFLTIKDITERKQAEEALRDAKINLEYKVNERTAQLVAKSKELENFCYSVSHDLRAPLRGIDGYSRLLLESYHERLDEEGRTFLKNVRAATKHMTDLIEDLLAYSKLERRTPSSTSVRLSTFVSNLLGQFQDLVGNVLLTVKVNDFHVNADPDALAIALRNLIDNALKFSRHASQPAIEISAQAGDGNCIISVRDNGIGFDMRFYDKIFEIFQRLHRIEEYPGTGIGLAMVHKAMERMGGRVWAESQLGNGAVFFLQLPLSCRAGDSVPQADPGLV